MIRLLNVFLCPILLCSCLGENVPPSRNYVAETEQVDVLEQVENIVREFAAKENLRVTEKDRRTMAVLTNGNPAISIAIWSADEPILIVTNSGIGKVLSIASFESGSLSSEELDELFFDLVDGLEVLGLEFSPKFSTPTSHERHTQG